MCQKSVWHAKDECGHVRKGSQCRDEEVKFLMKEQTGVGALPAGKEWK